MAANSHAWHLENIDGLYGGRGSAAAVVHGGCVYIVGGRKGNIFYNDILCIDLVAKTCKTVAVDAENQAKFSPRGNHTATLISGEIWVIGGSDKVDTFSDVCVFSIPKGEWRFPDMLLKNGGAGSRSLPLTARTAHAAEIHPFSKSSILVMGGWGNPGLTDVSQDKYTWLNNMFVVNTLEHTIELLSARGRPPSVRGYHSFTLEPEGNRLLVIGGRTEDANVGERHMVVTLVVSKGPQTKEGTCHYDYEWRNDSVAGLEYAMTTRSSHRAVALGNRIIIYGGADSPAAERNRHRLDDVTSLILNSSNSSKLEWSSCDRPSLTPAAMLGRSAHIFVSHGSTLYCLFGYSGQSDNNYMTDCWSLRLSPTVSTNGQRHRQGQVHALVGEEVPFVTKPSTKGGSGGGGSKQVKSVAQPAPSLPLPRSQGQAPGVGGVGGGGEEEVMRNAKRQKVQPRGDPQATDHNLSPQPQPSVKGLLQSQGLHPYPAVMGAEPLAGTSQQQRNAYGSTLPASAMLYGLPPSAAAAGLSPGRGGEMETGGGESLSPRLALALADRDVQQLRSENANLYTSYTIIEAELKLLRKGKEEDAASILTLRQAKEEKERQAMETQRLLAQSQDEIVRINRKLQQSESNASIAEGVHSRVSSELRTRLSDLSELQGRFNLVQTKLESSERELATERRRGESLEDSVSQLHASLTQANTRLQSGETILASERAEASRNKESHLVAMKNVEAALESTREELRAVRLRLIGSDEQVSQMKGEATALLQRARAAEEGEAKAEGEKRRLEGENAQLKEKEKALKEVSGRSLEFYRNLEQMVGRETGPMRKLQNEIERG